MRQTARIISTYSADTFGVCSALFELGGMTVMHDASGCNSTYTTHDEPRWYDMDSMVYISGLSEMEAIMGDDQKLVDDIVEAAKELKPAFIAVAGTPIPAMTGFDYESVAYVIEQETGIPAFGFATTGMNTYVQGASTALEAYARRFVEKKIEKTAHLSANILGLTPLDFSVNGTDASIEIFLQEAGFEVVSKWAMGSKPEELAKAGKARVNLVVSATGLGVAKAFKEMFGTPYVVGVPISDPYKKDLQEQLFQAAMGMEKEEAPKETTLEKILREAALYQEKIEGTAGESWCQETIGIVGEGVFSLSLAKAIERCTGKKAKVICATECAKGILREGDVEAMDEESIEMALKGMKIVIADPLYQPICPENANFISLPTESFSGRIYRQDIPNLTADFSGFLEKIR